MISLETPQRKWASSRLEGRTSWIFSSCGRCSQLKTGPQGPLWWPQERPVPKRVARGPLGGLSGFLSRRCWGVRPCVESVPEPEDSSPVPEPEDSSPVPEPEDSSPVPTWILWYFWSLPRGVSSRVEWGPADAISSRALASVSLFPSCGSRDLWLSLEASLRGFPTRLSHEAFPQGSPTCHRGVSRSSA